MPEITNETERQFLMEREVRRMFEHPTDANVPEELKEMPWLETAKPGVRRAFMVPIVSRSCELEGEAKLRPMSKWMMPSGMYASKKTKNQSECRREPKCDVGEDYVKP